MDPATGLEAGDDRRFGGAMAVAVGTLRRPHDLPVSPGETRGMSGSWDAPNLCVSEEEKSVFLVSYIVGLHKI
jgi:hypothetical protein